MKKSTCKIVAAVCLLNFVPSVAKTDCLNWNHYTEAYGNRVNCFEWMDHFQCMDHWTPEVQEGALRTTTVTNRRQTYPKEECTAKCGTPGNVFNKQDVAIIELIPENTIQSVRTLTFVMCEPLTEAPPGMF